MEEIRDGCKWMKIPATVLQSASAEVPLSLEQTHPSWQQVCFPLVSACTSQRPPALHGHYWSGCLPWAEPIAAHVSTSSHWYHPLLLGTFRPAWPQCRSLFSDKPGMDALKKEQGQYLPSSFPVRAEAAFTPHWVPLRKNQALCFNI